MVGNGGPFALQREEPSLPGLEVTRSVTVTIDELVGIGELERAALEFARTAPAELIAVTVAEMIDTLIDEVVGPCGLPRPDDEQPVAPWACPGCASMRGFRRRGTQVRQRKRLSWAFCDVRDWVS